MHAGLVLPRLDLLTLAVPDLATARRFYVDGLGWTPALDVPGEIIFLQLNHGLLVGLFPADRLAADLADPSAAVLPGSGFTLAHNVDSPDDVDRTVSRAAAAGATVIKAPQDADFGGYHAYFADPCGIRWEIAHNPGWRVEADGRVTIGAVS